MTPYGEIKRNSIGFFFPFIGWHTLKFVLSISTYLTAGQSVCRLSDWGKPWQRQRQQHIELSTAFTVLYLCAPWHYQALEILFFYFFSDALLCLTSWRYCSVGFPLIYPTYRTYRHTYIWYIHMCRRLDCLANTWHDLVHLVRFLWYRRIYLHIVEKKVNKRFNDITKLWICHESKDREG